MDKDTRLEELSDKVRRGICIGVSEALEVIAYQSSRKEYRKSLPWWRRIFAN